MDSKKSESSYETENSTDAGSYWPMWILSAENTVSPGTIDENVSSVLFSILPLASFTTIFKVTYPYFLEPELVTLAPYETYRSLS